MLAEFSLDSCKVALAFCLANSMQETLFLLFVLHWSDFLRSCSPSLMLRDVYQAFKSVPMQLNRVQEQFLASFGIKFKLTKSEHELVFQTMRGHLGMCINPLHKEIKVMTCLSRAIGLKHFTAQIRA